MLPRTSEYRQTDLGLRGRVGVIETLPLSSSITRLGTVRMQSVGDMVQPTSGKVSVSESEKPRSPRRCGLGARRPRGGASLLPRAGGEACVERRDLRLTSRWGRDSGNGVRVGQACRAA